MTHAQPPIPRSNSWLPTLTIVALVSGCATIGSDRFVDAPTLVSGETRQSELNTSSPANLNNGARFSAHWFCATADDPRAFYQFQAPFVADLTLFNEQSELIDYARVNPMTSDATSILMGPNPEGCTLLVINGADDESFGPFRLISQPLQAQTETLMSNQSLVGVTSADDTPLRYPLSVDSPTQFGFTLHDASRSLGMQLTGKAVSRQAIACGDSTLTLDAYLEPGDYELVLQPGQRPEASIEDQHGYDTAALCTDALVDQGSFFKLDTVSTELPRGIRNGGVLVSGETLSGLMLSTQGNRYLLELEQPSEVVISLASDDFDTMLSISGDGVKLDNDDYGEGTDSQLSSILMPGRYTVTALSYENYPVDGLYTLETRVVPFTGDLRNSGPITPGTSLIGMRNATDNHYTLTITEPSEIRIALNSASFDTTLALSGNGLELNDDDGGGGTNSLITTLLQPGTYSLSVGSYSGNGLFDLTVTRDNISGTMRNGGSLRAGDVVYGNLSNGGTLTYTLSLGAARTVRIDAVSSAVDTVIALSGPALSLEDDDGGGGTNSRLEEFLPAGIYTLEVRDFSGNQSGQVRIEVQMDFSDAQS